MKKCTICGNEFPEVDIRKRNSKDVCKDCKNIIQSLYRDYRGTTSILKLAAAASRCRQEYRRLGIGGYTPKQEAV